MASVNTPARQAQRYNRFAPALHQTTGLCNWHCTAFVMWSCCAGGSMQVCVHTHKQLGQRKQSDLRINRRGGGGEHGGEGLLLGTYTSNKLMSRPVWSHNFSIQREIKLGSSSIDFFSGVVAVFLSTNSKLQTFARAGWNLSAVKERVIFGLRLRQCLVL